MNKYLTKIAKIRQELEDRDLGRQVGRSFAYSLAGGGIGGHIGRKVAGQRGAAIGSTIGAIGGAISGDVASGKNQLREQQLHDIKLQDAGHRHQAHKARMLKLASIEVSDQVKKDAFSLGTLVAAGGAGNVIADKVLRSGKLGKPTSAKTFVLGGGMGLIGDYAAIKLGQGYNNYLDRKK